MAVLSTSSDWTLRTKAHAKQAILSHTFVVSLFVALAAFVTLRFILAASFPFIDTTEARYAEMARLMVTSGDWITPQFDEGVPFWGKPPLHTWLSAIGMKLFGVTEFGGRILILIAGLATATAIYLWSRAVRNRDIALLATVILFGNGLFVGAAGFVMTDMPMVLGTTLSMIAFWQCIHLRSPKRSGLLFFVGLAIGMLAKGPVAVVIVAISVFGWGVMAGCIRQSIRAIPWRSGGLVFLVLVLPWYVAAELKTPGFLRYFLIGEHFERFIVSGWDGDLYGSGHARSKGAIWVGFAQAFFPWSLGFLPPLLRIRSILATTSKEEQTWLLYLLAWVLSPLILFTPSANILAAYALPALPAASLLLVELWRLLLKTDNRPIISNLAKFGFIGSWTTVFAFFGYLLFVSGNPERRPMHRTAAFALKSLGPTVLAQNRIVFLRPRSYSADFYSDGRAEYIETDEGLAEVLSSPQPGYLFATENSITFPVDKLEYVSEVGPYTTYALPRNLRISENTR